MIDIAQSLRVLLGRGTDNAEPKVEFTRLFPNADDVCHAFSSSDCATRYPNWKRSVLALSLIHI